MVYQCRFCGYSSNYINDFEHDETTHKGFWCCYCDGYTFYNKEEDNQAFLLFLENNASEETNASYVKLVSNASPLRYPGGKSKVVGRIYQECRKEHLSSFVEPYAGGASVGLSFLLSGVVKELYLNDLDKGVYSLHKTIKTSPEALYALIEAYIPTKESYYNARDVIKNDYKGCTELEAAWNLLIANRLAFSGIVKANCMSNLYARWNPKTLIKRIEHIHQYKDHIHVFNQDAISFIEEMYWQPDSTIFIDPPYFKKGKDLYHCYYSKEEHERLAELLHELYEGFPGADMIVIYDNHPYIEQMYIYPIKKLLPRKYSISNKGG